MFPLLGFPSGRIPRNMRAIKTKIQEFQGHSQRKLSSLGTFDTSEANIYIDRVFDS